MFECVKFFFRKKNEQYVFKDKTNKFGIFKLSHDRNTEIGKLDTANILVWICDKDLKVLFATIDKPNHIYPKDYIGKYLDKVGPADVFSIGSNLLKESFNGKCPETDMICNGKPLYLTAKPLFYSGELFGGALFIIPYI
jgi:hypothetical protein